MTGLGYIERSSTAAGGFRDLTFDFATFGFAESRSVVALRLRDGSVRQQFLWLRRL
jgi:hypothetical protein